MPIQSSLPIGNYLSNGNATNGDRSIVATWQHDPVELPPFQKILDAQMKDRGINQPALAACVRVTTSAVNRWLSGERMPGGQDLLAIARVLKMDPYDLMGSSFVEPEPRAEPVRQGRPPKGDMPIRVVANAVRIPRDKRATPPAQRGVPGAAVAVSKKVRKKSQASE